MKGLPNDEQPQKGRCVDYRVKSQTDCPELVRSGVKARVDLFTSTGTS